MRGLRTQCVQCVLLCATLSCIQGFQPSITNIATTNPKLHFSTKPRATPCKPFSRGHRRSGSSTELSISSNPIINTFSQVGSPLASLGVLAFVVLVHETGHFLAARSFGIDVDEFSVGVGPKVFGFEQRKGKDGEEGSIEFNLRLIPLGGYVRFPENYNRTLAEEIEIEEYELKQEARKRRREKESGVIEVAAMEEDEQKSGNKLQSFLQSLGFSAAAKETTRTVPATEVTQFKSEPWWKSNSLFNTKKNTPPPPPPEPRQIEYYDNPNLLQNRSWRQRAVVLCAGVVFNIILAFSCYLGELTVARGLPRPEFAPGAVVTAQPIERGASFGYLQRGDVIVGVNDHPIKLAKAQSAASAQQSISEFISTIRATPPGDSIKLSVLRTVNDPLSSLASSNELDVIIQPRPMTDEYGAITGPTSIGVMLAPNYLRTEFVHATSFPDAVVKASDALTEVTTETATSIFGFFSSVFKGQVAVNSGQISGPIGVIRTGSQIVSSNDVSAVIAFMAAISINLAVVNSLPFPGLDGGQMVFVLSEAVSGRTIDQRRQEEINAFALFLLLLFSLGTAVGDVGSIVNN